MSPILGIWASQNYSRYSLPTSFESIATTTVGSGGTSSITFSSIPSTYTHLQIRASIRMSVSGQNWAIQPNSDNTGNNYSLHQLYGTGSVAGSNGASDYPYGLGNSSPNTANIFSAGIMDILDYANTNKYKTLRTLGGYDTNGGGSIELRSSNWRSTSAITSLLIFPESGTFQQYTTFALYGIKGA